MSNLNHKWEYCHVLHTYLFSKRATHSDEIVPVYGVVATYYRADGQHQREQTEDMYPETVVARLGLEGWELTSVEYDADKENLTRRIFYFKRRVE